MTRRRIVGTAGHIDHGKTALVRALTGVDTDRLPEEKRRGITIDLGFASFVAGDVQVGFIDVPGHERFVRNMLAGVGGIDAALLVVAADESIKPQTLEHFAICRMLRIPTGLVAITKKDLVDPDTLELVRLEIEELTGRSFLEGQPVIPVSSTTGDGIEILRQKIVEVVTEAPDRDASTRAFRLPIDRVFTMKGFGCVVTGTTVSGQVRVDSELEVLPLGRRTRARQIQVHGESRDIASAGERTSINLPDIDVGELERGEQLVQPGLLKPSQVLTTEIELLAGAPAVNDQTRVRFHHFSSEVMGSVRLLGSAKKIAAGERAFVQIRLEKPVVAWKGDRFILRRYSPQTTIGGGVVLDPHMGRARGLQAGVLETLRDGTLVQHVEILARLSGVGGVTVADVVSRTGLLPQGIGALESPELLRVGERWVHRQALEALRRLAMETLMDHFKAKPMSLGLPRGEMVQKLMPPDADAALTQFLFDDLTREKILMVEGDLIQVPGRSRDLRGTEGELARLIEQRFRDGGLHPPPISELIHTIAQKPKVIDGVVGYLVKTGVLVRLAEAVYIHSAALTAAREQLQPHRGESVDVGWFKDFYGISRKIVIPLLEHFDRLGATKRVGDRRIIL